MADRTAKLEGCLSGKVTILRVSGNRKAIVRTADDLTIGSLVRIHDREECDLEVAFSIIDFTAVP